MPLLMLSVKDEIEVLAEIFPFFIIKMADDLQNRPSTGTRLELRLLLPDTPQQGPNHFRAVGKFLK